MNSIFDEHLKCYGLLGGNSQLAVRAMDKILRDTDVTVVTKERS